MPRMDDATMMMCMQCRCDLGAIWALMRHKRSNKRNISGKIGTPRPDEDRDDQISNDRMDLDHTLNTAVFRTEAAPYESG